MSFFDVLAKLDRPAVTAAMAAVDAKAVERTLAKPELTVDDLPTLLSPAAASFVESMSSYAQALTRKRFGRVVNLYAPLYLSNECTNNCVYCGFSASSKTARKSLTLDEARVEGDSLARRGFGHVLLVTGEHRRRFGVDALAEVVEALGDQFHSISIEVFPMEVDEYERLEALGVDGLTLYQETYDPEVYSTVHLKGQKTDFRYRLDGPERGAQAGFRTLGIGALLGLADWRMEAVCLGLHTAYLLKHAWRTRVALSFPRIVGAGTGFAPPHPVSDEELVHMVAALRCVFPDAEMVLSTRERAPLRDRMMGLGVTRMSAGSVTSPGGYEGEETTEQFDVVDGRSAEEVAAVLTARGFEPVWKDFDRLMRGDAVHKEEGR